LSSVVLASGEEVHLVTAGFFGIGADDATLDTLMLLAAASGTDLKVTTPSSYTVQLDAGEIYLDADFGLVAVLPVTGLDTTTIALIALVLLLAGGAAVFVTTRKREDEGEIAA
jgi:LPXTG-motif cell wall-anchored protein